MNGPITIDDLPYVVQVDVEISREAWGLIRRMARAQIERGGDPEDAFWDAVYEYITTLPNIVDGEVVGPGDVVPGDE